MSLSERISVYRKQKGLTQESFAYIIGVSFATLSRWENGHTVPRGLHRKVIERILRKAEKIANKPLTKEQER